jgi:hypothetical protein
MVVRRSGQFKPLQGQLTLAAAQLNHIEEAAARHGRCLPEEPRVRTAKSKCTGRNRMEGARQQSRLACNGLPVEVLTLAPAKSASRKFLVA